MTDQRCGTCRLFEPTRNPATGRPRPTEPGQCGWEPPAWPVMADSYSRVQFSGPPAPDWPTKRGMYASMGAGCKTWAAKKPGKAMDRQASLIVLGGA